MSEIDEMAMRYFEDLPQLQDDGADEDFLLAQADWSDPDLRDFEGRLPPAPPALLAALEARRLAVQGRHVGHRIHPESSTFPRVAWIEMALSGALGVHPVDVYRYRESPNWEQPPWALPSWALTLPEHPVQSPYESRCRCCGGDVVVLESVLKTLLEPQP